MGMHHNLNDGVHEFDIDWRWLVGVAARACAVFVWSGLHLLWLRVGMRYDFCDLGSDHEPITQGDIGHDDWRLVNR